MVTDFFFVCFAAIPETISAFSKSIWYNQYLCLPAEKTGYLFEK